VHTELSMRIRRARVLVVDDLEHTLSIALDGALARHQVDVAKDAIDAIYRIDCSSRPYDFVLCDIARGDLPGPEMWAYLSISRRRMAERMVFVASTVLSPDTRRFLDRVPNPCVWLPAAADTFDGLVNRCAISTKTSLLSGD
jgi:hypothetical protein